MAFRGQRRGGLGASRYDKPEPFVIFPEITLRDPESIKKDSDLVIRYYKYENFWRNSSYHLGDGVLKRENDSLDIERYSDTLKPKRKSNKSGLFYDYLVLRPDNFPRDLLGDTRRERPVKRAKWSPDADRILEELEKLEAKFEAEGKDEEDDEEEEDKPEEGDEEDKPEEDDEPKEDDDEEEDKPKEEESDEEDKPKEEESDEEESDEEDYKEDFEDDDDDYNQADDSGPEEESLD